MDQNIPNIPQELPQQPEPSFQELPKENKFPKFLITILIVVGILIASYFAVAKYQKLWPFELVMAPNPTATPDDTSNWKTYRNDDYGFEVKYPNEAGWDQNIKLIEERYLVESGGYGTYDLYFYNASISADRASTVLLSITKQDDTASQEDNLKKQNVKFAAQIFEINAIKGTKILIGEDVPPVGDAPLAKSAYKFHWNSFVYHFPNPDKSYYFTFFINAVHPELDKALIQTANDILSTFKFTK